jgi:hypothetical protein
MRHFAYNGNGMKPTVYVETSVVSALVDERTDPVSHSQRVLTEEWWRRESRQFELRCSEAVLLELERGEFPGKRKAVALVRGLPWLPITPEVIGLARLYQQHLVMPKGEGGDAVHLAVACEHEVEYLLTWNCRHLANANKLRRIQAINMRQGLLTPAMVTPPMLCGTEDKT